MSFVRAEARAALWRWREVIFGSFLGFTALLWGLGSFGFLRVLAAVIFGIAVLIVLAGLQRSRFRAGGGGQGVVQVIEGQITYYGPLSGGAVAIAELTVLSIDGRSKPAHWLLVSEQGTTLEIPVTAEGADALFDAFNGLAGLRTEHLLRIKQSGAARLQVVWRRSDAQARINGLN
ncbi:MAG: hypothetical protein WBC85_06195 [Planktotalea sp.]|uniref:hypothetical protein n=1 Tax=Planktotalea sp. TaxID=2029877 RepID=UPI003C758EDD